MSDSAQDEFDTEQPVLQLKARIIAAAQKGVFARNPLLTTVHELTCPHCHQHQRIVYLESLKTGDFDVGTTERIEVLDSSGPMGIWEREPVTPIIIRCCCEVCGNRFEARPVSVEYLQRIIANPSVSNAMYV